MIEVKLALLKISYDENGRYVQTINHSLRLEEKPFDVHVKIEYTNWGTCKVLNEIEPKQNEIKQNETKPNETKRNRSKRNETKCKKTKRNATKRIESKKKPKRNQTKRNETDRNEM